MSSTRAVSRTRLSAALRPLARLRFGRNDRFGFDAIALIHSGTDGTANPGIVQLGELLAKSDLAHKRHSTFGHENTTNIKP